MAPPLRHPPVNRSLVRIPGSGSDGGSARPLALNLARSVNDFSENLHAMALFGGALGAEFLASSFSLRENLVRVALPLFGESSTRPSELGNTEQLRRVTKKTLGGAGREVRKRSLEASEESEPKKRACPSEVACGAAVARENLAVRVSGASCVSHAPSSRSETSDGDGSSLGDADGTERSRTIMKPRSTIDQLLHEVEEMQRQQIESEKEKGELQEEVADLRRKVACFREIFQNTNKLKAVLQRLNIRI